MNGPQTGPFKETPSFSFASFCFKSKELVSLWCFQTCTSLSFGHIHSLTTSPFPQSFLHRSTLPTSCYTSIYLNTQLLHVKENDSLSLPRPLLSSCSHMSPTSVPLPSQYSLVPLLLPDHVCGSRCYIREKAQAIRVAESGTPSFLTYPAFSAGLWVPKRERCCLATG